MASVDIDHVVMRYRGAHNAAVDDVTLHVEDGEFFVLVGPSGCGKSTLLRLIAGLEHPSSGAIRLDGADATALSPADRDVAMVFQNYAIYPHMSVRRNIGYGLRVRGVDRRDVAVRVDEVAGLLGLEELLDRRPSTLSGGQLQRVAMGRAIARRPRVFLMDEPLSNLDAKLRVSMRAELEHLHHRLGVTTIYVTHDQVEAMTLGDRAAVLRDGVVQQVDTPQRLYGKPANSFVAAFVGAPPMNFAVGRMRDESLLLGGFAIPLPERCRPAVHDDRQVLVGIRPEDLHPVGAGEGGADPIEAECVAHQDLGADVLLFLAMEEAPEEREAVERATRSETAAGEAPSDRRRRLLCARVGGGCELRAGDRACLGVAVDALHFFALDDGRRIEPRGVVSEVA